MFMILATLAALYLVGCLIVMRSVRRAKAGYEDAAGFHFGGEEALPKVALAGVRSSRTRPVEASALVE